MTNIRGDSSPIAPPVEASGNGATMRVAEYDAYGPPEVIKVREGPLPELDPHGVLVRVHGASVSGGETIIRAGKISIITGRTFPRRLGNDFAGEIVKTGSRVNMFKAGDRVWGLMPHMQFGSIADYVSLPAERVALAPRELDLVRAASLPAAGTTAIRALRTEASLMAGERLLIRGASGGVGNLAVQLGKAIGAHVTGIAGGSNIDWVQKIGADVAVDYATIRPTDLGRFDVILDLVGSQMETYRQMLAPGGRMVGLAFNPDQFFRTLVYLGVSSFAGSKRVRAFSNDPGQGEIEELTRLIESGTLSPHVSKVWDIKDVAQAHRAAESGGLRGNQVVRLVPSEVMAQRSS